VSYYLCRISCNEFLQVSDPMQSSNMCFIPSVASGANVLPEVYNQNTQLHLTNPVTQFVPSNSGAVPVQLNNNSAPLQTNFAQNLINNTSVNNPNVGLIPTVQNGNVFNTIELKGNFQYSNLVNPGFTTTNLVPPTGNLYPSMNFASSPTFNSFTPFTYPVAGNGSQFSAGVQMNLATPANQQITTAPVLMAVPQQTNGYEMQVSDPALAFDSGQTQLQPSPIWKSDPSQTPTQQQMFTFPTFTPNGSVYLQAPGGPSTLYHAVPQYPVFNMCPTMSTQNMASSSYTPTECSVSARSSSVESATSMPISTTGHVDPSILGMPNAAFSNAIQNFGNPCLMEFMAGNNGELQFAAPIPTPMTAVPTTTSTNFTTLTHAPMFHQNSVMHQVPSPSPVNIDVQNNQNSLVVTPEQGHRGRSRSANSGSPPGFAEAHRSHNIVNEQHPCPPSYVSQNNVENSRSTYHGRPSNEEQRNRNMRNNKRYASNHANSGWSSVGNGPHRHKKSVPMVDSRKQNQRPRKNRTWNTTNKSRNAADKPRSTNKRYGYRTKQNKIEKVYASVTQHFDELGVLSPEDVGIRGTTVARLHVKKWHSLSRIEEAIAKVEAIENIETQRVSCPVSMKNLYQKKGFLIYWETASEEQTQLLMDVFKSFNEKDRDGKFILDEFQKISVAVQTTEQKEQTETELEKNASSPVVEKLVKKAVVASLDNCAAEPTTYPQEEDFSPMHVKVYEEMEAGTKRAKDSESVFAEDDLFDDLCDDSITVLPLLPMTSTNSLCGA